METLTPNRLPEIGTPEEIRAMVQKAMKDGRLLKPEPETPAQRKERAKRSLHCTVE